MTLEERVKKLEDKFVHLEKLFLEHSSDEEFSDEDDEDEEGDLDDETDEESEPDDVAEDTRLELKKGRKIQ